jgi:uncharacterized Zn finger protein
MNGIPQRVVREPSRVDIALTRESVDVTAQVTIGSEEVVRTGSPVNVNADVGTLPSFETDHVISTFADAGEEIAIIGGNANAAAQELRANVRIVALDDAEMIPPPRG